MSFAALLLLSTLSATTPLEARLAEIEASSKGKLGAAVVTSRSRHYWRKGEKFTLESVMKLMVSMAALDQVDKGRWKRDQKFTFRRSDLSMGNQPLSDILGKRSSMTVTLAQCIELTVTQSCSASGDFMIRKMGGVPVVQRFLKRHGIAGLSIDRQERDLQTFVDGLTWKPEYVDPRRFEADLKKVSYADRMAAFRRYQKETRDTTTPEAMALLLEKLVRGKLLSPSSTRYLLKVMESTKTGAGRLKAGVPQGWTLAHKTGTGSTREGVAWATNDVGIARRPNGDWVVVVALLRGSTLKPEERESVLARVAEAALATPDTQD